MLSKRISLFVVLVGAVSLAMGACSSSGDDDGKGSGGRIGAAGTGGGSGGEGGTGGADGQGGEGGAGGAGGQGGEGGAGGTAGGGGEGGGEGGSAGTGGPSDPWADLGCREVVDAFEPCGGELEGTWKLATACKENQIGEELDCPEFTGGVTLGYSAGFSITFTEDELSIPATTRTLSLLASMPLSCTDQLGMGDIESCADLSGPESGTCSGDEVCTCEGEDVKAIEASTQSYDTQNGGLELQDTVYFYCVQGTSLYLLGQGIGETGPDESDSYLFRFTRQ